MLKYEGIGDDADRQKGNEYAEAFAEPQAGRGLGDQFRQIGCFFSIRDRRKRESHQLV